ncbi:hydrolase [Herbiconiux sp. L3-i23]|uniref:hydrolase n=1 Tax=Herbiconiux sp. L3-i23 TaxID=2905871 RepID=UPI0020703716|nr:hydrolase [Herbiconiux sp. L3-i23]BDI24108.1 hydrolase [Herbiconiux sp. L3-i23]
MRFWICATCGVEHAERTAVCDICADERQWVPESGQKWTTLEELAARGEQTRVVDLEPGLIGITSSPNVGIGQWSKLVTTAEGSVLWDPIGYLDDSAVERIASHGPVLAIAASHPHMYGVQVEWSRRLGDAPVLIAEADAHWVRRDDPVIEIWSGEVEIAPGLTLHQIGGHFPGSAVLQWRDGAEGRGALLVGDTIFPNPDRTSVSFMRSYPNRIPLSGPVALRIADSLNRLDFDRLYGNFDNVIADSAKQVISTSAERHAAWARGDFDDLT